MYNQLLKEKTATMDEENKKLLQENEDQKAKILKMEDTLIYIEDQLTKLQANQNARTPSPACNPPLPLLLNSS